MPYKLDLSASSPLASPPVTGAMIHPANFVEFVPWQPSTWPEAPGDDHEFILVLKDIFQLSMLLEISHVIEDATTRAGSLVHRGHVIAISLLCALDTISSYGYGARSGSQIPPFIKAHFPESYKDHANALLCAYRHTMIHSWNLFGAAIFPGNEDIEFKNEILSFGLLNFFNALKYANEHFLESALQESALMKGARVRYAELRGGRPGARSAEASPRRAKGPSTRAYNLDGPEENK